MTLENDSYAQSVFVVHNPVAGTSDPATVRREIENHLAGRKYQIYETTGKDNIREVVRHALREGYQTVWAAGGDGTVSSVANALAQGDVPLGIVPLGSGNILAKELDIPLDVTAACDLLTGVHQTRLLDILKVKDEVFVLAVSAGIGGMMMVETPREQKRHLGHLAYLWNGLRILLSKSLWPFRVFIDGQPFVVRASEVIAANAGVLGYKPIRWGEQVRPDDGRIDLCYIRVRSVRESILLLGGLLLEKQDHLDELTCNTAYKTIEIQSRRRIPVQGDGEHIGFTPVRIEIIPKCLPVIVPALEE